MGERKVDMAIAAFNTTPEGNLEFEDERARAVNIDGKDFGKLVLNVKTVKKDIGMDR